MGGGFRGKGVREPQAVSKHERRRGGMEIVVRGPSSPKRSTSRNTLRENNHRATDPPFPPSI